jgi:hypothetical protein
MIKPFILALLNVKDEVTIGDSLTQGMKVISHALQLMTVVLTLRLPCLKTQNLALSYRMRDSRLPRN